MSDEETLEVEGENIKEALWGVKHQHRVWFTYWSWQTDTSSQPWQSFPPASNPLFCSRQQDGRKTRPRDAVESTKTLVTWHNHLCVRLGIKSLASISSSRGKWSTNAFITSSYLMFWHGAGKLAELNIDAAVRAHRWKSKLAFCRRRPGHGA